MSRDNEEGPIVMNHERPLDALIPELAESRAPMPTLPLHQRVLEVETEGGFEWMLACWRDPGGAAKLHGSLKQLVEATLLSTLSAPPRRGVEVLGRRFEALRLMVFEAIAGLEDAVRAFGMAAVPYEAASYTERMGVLRDEAQRMGWGEIGEPAMVLEAQLEHRADARLEGIQAHLVEALGDADWGSDPGRPSKLMAEFLASRGVPGLSPELSSLDTLESVLVSRTPNVIRWMPPLVFAALCDFIGVVIQSHYDVEVLWAVCEEDSFGMCPPPLFRLGHPEGRIEHFPVGLFVLRWCIMPIGAGEQVPPLSAWIEGEFSGSVRS